MNDWIENFDTFKNNKALGVVFETGDNPADFPGDINNLPLVCVRFPNFTDGRVFSIGRIIREELGYQGELRACGEFIRDQLFYLKRCGFNSFDFASDIDLEAAINSLTDFSDSYQTATDQAQPLFRRR